MLTLGGRDAKHVVRAVREELGCDPEFSFTIRVSVVDVDGTRLVIEAETTSRPDPALEPKLERALESALEPEVQQIVESIRFGP